MVVVSGVLCCLFLFVSLFSLFVSLFSLLKSKLLLDLFYALVFLSIDIQVDSVTLFILFCLLSFCYA